VSVPNRTIAVLGGTGNLGGGLAYRWSKAGLNVVIGSRSKDKAAEAAKAVATRVPNASMRGMTNEDAASEADIIVLTIPFAHQKQLLEAIRGQVQGKIVIDTTVSLVPPRVGTVQLPPEGSAGVIAQNFLGDGTRVVSAFQNIAASHVDSDQTIHCHVLVCGNDEDARQEVIDLADLAGMKAWHAGPIENSAAAEALTSVLISLNRRYKIPGSGIVITGEPTVK
jgi:NADPH-dependent F420 reductase